MHLASPLHAPKRTAPLIVERRGIGSPTVVPDRPAQDLFQVVFVQAGAATHALLNLLLFDISRAAAQVGTEAVSPHTGPLLLRVFSFIEERYRTPIGLADVAKAVARSPSYLTDLVRRQTGRTVLQWIIHRRMAEARRLLLDPRMRVKDVGPRIGYDDVGHFIRLFRRLNGQTPQQWRAGGPAGIRLHAGPQLSSPDRDSSRSVTGALSEFSNKTPRPLATSHSTQS